MNLEYNDRNKQLHISHDMVATRSIFCFHELLIKLSRSMARLFIKINGKAIHQTIKINGKAIHQDQWQGYSSRSMAGYSSNYQDQWQGYSHHSVIPNIPNQFKFMLKTKQTK